MKTTTTIESSEALRIAKRLSNHWKHKFDVANSDDQYQIFMPKVTVELSIQPDQLHVSIVNKEISLEELIRLKNVVLDHINRMVQADYQVIWSRES
ncbi:DUF2218 domain-containing protein [Acinetobacter sp. Ver3]|uniref:DUF2218 domain-containing protein n=1 Tax=Acinetobacter sp. Ver3 TaxID=466088 RepID=UPI00044D2805|nr:DUF2218 domain-containing protein [Acinetobacter sp. Ver3]EZQ02423.1 hypothetical protein CL42_11345 [Acinetobacter sp. Ver3]